MRRRKFVFNKKNFFLSFPFVLAVKSIESKRERENNGNKTNYHQTERNLHAENKNINKYIEIEKPTKFVILIFTFNTEHYQEAHTIIHS